MKTLPPSFRAEVPGSPPRKNRRHDISAGGGVRNSDEFNEFVKRLHAAWAAAGHPVIRSGRWRLLLECGWPRKTKLDDGTVVALGDVDAPVSVVLDALQRCGVLDDDARVLEQASTKFHDPENPRVIITMEVCDA
ncbi:hypothetical protein OV079_23920 [Nannocystis pusilla]|uniref:Uncharacterized protein n=1 Tax=Nannocystis pusilla TaxID=889268 RepID=A0A9X3ERJ1_9BACT|nr:hypothetical protein [Nannocystis pusilla]MCY1004025.1 hypothetical protein [Nannocystis pusilla]MCY1008551.1 hypothetical protein [Nannocystis pusilla]